MNPGKIASSLLIIAAIFALLFFGKSLLIPFVIAILIWYIINTVSHYIGEYKLVKKFLPNWAKTALSALIIVFVLTLVGTLIADNAKQMAFALPRYQKNVGHLFERIGDSFPSVREVLDLESPIKLRESLKPLTDNINFADIISNLLNTLSGMAGNTFLILIYVMFLFFEQAVFPKKIKALFPQEERYEQLQKILTDINEAIRAYLSVKLTVSLITAISSYAVMAIMGLDFAFFWAFLIFLLNFIPNIGSLIATIFPALLALIQFDTLKPFVVILVCVGAIQLIVGNLIEPRMMGSSLNISSLVVILALSLWGALWGVAGMILCVPITVIMMIIFAHFPSTRPIAILLSEKGELMHELEEIHEAYE